MTALVGSIQNSGLVSAAATAVITHNGTTAGNAIIVWGWLEGGTTGYTSITVTDGGDSWTNGTPENNSARSVFAAATFSTSGGNKTITVTFNGGSGGGYGEFFSAEVSGGLAAFDQHNVLSAFTTSPATLSGGSADAGTTDFVVAAYSAGGAGTSNAISSPCTGGAAWTAAGVSNDDSTNASGQCSYRINSSAVNNLPSWTFATTPLLDGSVAAVWSLKVSSGGVINTKSITETTTIIDVESKTALRNKLLSEAITIIDILTGVKSSGGVINTKSITETIDVTESGTFKSWTITMAPETLVIAEAISDSLMRGRVELEAIAVNDIERAALLRGRVINDAITVIDALAKTAVLNRSINDAITVIDVLTKVIVTGTVRVMSVSETIVINDVLSDYSLRMRAALETFVTSDQLSSTATRNRAQFEAIALLDLLTGLYIPYNPLGPVLYDTRFTIGQSPQFSIGRDATFALGGYA